MKKKIPLKKNLPPLPKPEELPPPPLSTPRPPKQKASKQPKAVLIPTSPKTPPEPLPRAMPKPSPPVFIKIEKYRDIVKNISDLKAQAVGLRDTLEVLIDVEAELKRALDVTNRTLDNLNIVLSDLESKLTRISPEEERVELPKIPLQPPREIEGYVRDLHKHIERIKHELESIPTK